MATLTEEQKTVVRNLIKNRSKDQLQTLGGYAGTGKTTIINTIAEVLSDWKICAYTGKAANVLRKKGLSDASTIHSLIYKPVQGPRGIEFALKGSEEIMCDGFIVDEASMVSKEIYEDLVSFDLPIIFVGDHGQLEPVGQDVNVMSNPMFRLETVHRNAGEIAHFAEHLRKGRLARTFQADDKVEFIAPDEVSDEVMLTANQMICAYNRFRVGKNDHMRRVRGYTKLLEKGEKIMCLRNNKAMGLFNGMQGEVVRTKRDCKMDFKAGGMIFEDIRYDPNQFGKERNQFEFGSDTPHPFDYADTITCHKSQGDEWENLLVFEQECDKWDHKRWTYTAASRGKEKVWWVVEKRHVPSWL